MVKTEKTDEILAMKEVLKMIRLINLEMYMRNIYSMNNNYYSIYQYHRTGRKEIDFTKDVSKLYDEETGFKFI
ncbi:hypothetical protein J2Z80_002398 [Thermoanaerobacterium butyriciformans]|uniref:Uncharacterized protein n=2 Tax=Thermoanaerobacterium butyriciformans TaxID=1702242 RepID=A0ABS4NGP4_9THEO|nr:hypothetical protein [Thermoanaerobacterium butyriciformans]